MAVILTKRDAEIVDDALRYLIKHYPEGYNKETYSTVNHTLRGEDKTPFSNEEELHAAFKAVYVYWQNLAYEPYTLIQGTYDLEVAKNAFTEMFLNSGGFTKMWQDEELDRVKAEQLRLANIRSATAVWVGVFFAIVAAFISWLSYKKEEPNYRQELKSLQEQLIKQNQLLLKLIPADTAAQMQSLDTSSKNR